MTIRDARRNCWRKVDEAESASEANPTAEFCHWRGARFTPRSKGRAENRANVRHADLRLGKRQGRRQKAIRHVQAFLAAAGRVCCVPDALPKFAGVRLRLLFPPLG